MCAACPSDEPVLGSQDQDVVGDAAEELLSRCKQYIHTHIHIISCAFVNPTIFIIPAY